MRARTSVVLFGAVEGLALLVVVVLVAHIRSFTERLWLPSTDHLPEVAPDEPWFILARSLLMVLALGACFALRDLYRWAVIVRPRLVIVRLLEGTITVCVVLPAVHYVMGVLDRNFELDSVLVRLQIHPALIIAASGAAFLTSYGLRMKWPQWVRGSGLAERIALVGRGPMIDLLEEEVRRRHDPGLQLIGFLDDAETAPAGRHILGPPAQADGLAAQHQIERMGVEDPSYLPDDVLLRLRLAGVQITDTSTFYERITGRVSPRSLSHPELFWNSSAPNGAYLAAKRMLDILLAGTGLVLASPLIILVAMLIKLESKGPVFYVQERTGANGRPFPVLKFRSMRVDAETASGPVWAARNDTRITRIGRWLRKLRIDEIPQLWSVLRNDMSLVGPRPERPFFVKELEQEIPHYGQRHLVKPGVTGWAQINYSYGNTVDDAFIKLQFDLYYLKYRSLALDLAILLRTIKVVVLQQGAV